MYNPSNKVLFALLLIAVLVTVLVISVGNAPVLVCAQTGVATIGLLWGMLIDAGLLVSIYKSLLVVEACAYLLAGAAFGCRVWNLFQTWVTEQIARDFSAAFAQ